MLKYSSVYNVHGVSDFWNSPQKIEVVNFKSHRMALYMVENCGSISGEFVVNFENFYHKIHDVTFLSNNFFLKQFP